MSSNNILLKLHFNLKRRLKFYRIMAKATDQRQHGMKPTVALESLIDIEKENNKGKDTKLSKVYTIFLENYSLGQKLGEVMSIWVPASEAVQIFAAERAGRLSDGFSRAYEIAKQQAKFSKLFKQALVGPALNFVLAFSLLSMMFLKLVPTVSQSVSPDKRSGFSDLIYGMYQTYYVWFPALVIIVIAIVAWLIWALPNLNNRIRIKLENIPPFSLYRIMVGAGFLEAFNSLLSTNVQQREALLILEKFAKPYLKYRINKIQELTEQSFGQALISIKLNFPDKEVVKELTMASKQGNVAKALPDVVESFKTEGVELIEIQANIANGVAKGMVFGIIIFLVLGIFTFILDMASMLN
jgi:type II secretory pathway component PulF